MPLTRACRAKKKNVALLERGELWWFVKRLSTERLPLRMWRHGDVLVKR